MHPEFSALVQKKCDELGRELIPSELLAIFEDAYINTVRKYEIVGHPTVSEMGEDGNMVRVTGILRTDNNPETDTRISGDGNGPIDAFFHALEGVGISNYKFVDYFQHAISTGSDSKAVSYIHLMTPRGGSIFGVGISGNIYRSSIFGVLNAINRAELSK